MTVALSIDTPPLVPARLLIGGDWADGAAHLDVHNPARPDEVVGTIVRGTPDDVNRAVAAATSAQPAWANLGFRERARRLSSGLDALGADVEERCVLYVRENGKTLAEARGELAGLPDRLRLSLAYVDALETPRASTGPSGRTVVGYRPFGVVVSIVPWNSPVTLAFNQIVCALFAGNTVVVKPPETAPLALIASITAFARALPPGVIDIVTGLPDEIGDALTTHPDVAKIGFTGSIRAARVIAANAAQTIKSLTLELGGNDPAIVLEDADLSEATMDRMVAAAYQMTGQVCMAIKRIYVPAPMLDAFHTAFRRSAEKIVVGDGLVAGVTMGPLHSQAALTRSSAFVDDARVRGATVETVGTIHPQADISRGYFMRPTIVTDIDAAAPLVVEEQFCPSVPVIAYHDLDEAFTRANDSVYGLGGSIWSRDVDRALQLAERIESGTIWINTHGIGAIDRQAPYGGVKQSGIGRKSGLEGVLDYIELQTITTYE